MQPFAVRRMHIPIGEDSPTPMAPPEGVVLLVTEDDDLRAAAERALKTHGYDVIGAAHSGHAVLASLKTGRLDVLVTELSMPDISGPVLARWLRRHHPALPVVYFAPSGTPSREGVLIRPFTSSDLVRELDAALSETKRLAL